MVKKANIKPSTLVHNCRFEIMEDRIVLSANPVVAMTTSGPEELDSSAWTAPQYETGSDLDMYALLNSSASTQKKYEQMFGLDQVRDLYGLDGSGQTIVIIDSGIAYDHNDLGGGFGQGYKVVGGYDFAENDNNPYDDASAGGHGTHIAGIIGSNSTLYPGVAPGVDIVVLRIFDDNGNANFDWLNQALQWVHANQNAFENPITTVNLSVGFQEDLYGYFDSINANLKVLHDDGIFISVAAGNSYQTSPDKMNYLANSEYVVAVGACNTTGDLSYFSQRDGSIIVAPGQNIKSTVPDYMGNKNGVADDYAILSGTSMASPYVAAASVLIRQAFGLIGKTDVNQDAIYDVMFRTADTIFDADSGGTYKRLNIQNAIESILPQDTLGDSASQATVIASQDGSFTLEGFFNTVNDRDYFVFTADQSGKVTIKAETSAGLNGTWDISNIPGAKIDANGNVTFEAVAGQKYTLGFNATGEIGAYTIKAWVGNEPIKPPVDPPVDPPVTPPVDPPVNPPVNPPVDPPVTESTSINKSQTTLGDQQLTEDGIWYAIKAVNSGIMTVEVTLPNGVKANNVVIEQLDSEGNVIATAQNTTRIDLNVTAGSTLQIRIRAIDGTISNATVQVTNLVRQEGKNILIVGTEDDDNIIYSAGSVHSVEINGAKYTFHADGVSSVHIDSGSGNDRVLLVGSGAAERVDMTGSETVFSSNSWRITVTGAETVSVDGNGGQDSFWFHGIEKNENLTVQTDRISVISEKFYAEIRNFKNVYAFSGGGQDTVVLYDSAGNDTLTVNESYAVFNSSGVNSQFYDFASLVAHATNGGHDTVTFTDTRGDDQFIGNAQSMKRLSGNQYAEANGFEQVNLVSFYNQGNDAVQLEDSTGDDTLVMSQHNVVLSGEYYSISVRGFDHVHASAVHGGNDRVLVYDTPEDGRVIARDKSIGVIDSVHEFGAYGFEEAWLYGRSNQVNSLDQGDIDYVLYALGEWSKVGGNE